MDTEQNSHHSPSFTLFSILPSELRLLIWQHTLTPRTHEISYNTLFHHGFESNHSCPTILCINKESRSFALTHYTLAFGSTFQPPSIYFNFTLDTLYLPTPLKSQIPHFFGILSDFEMQHLRYLAISAAIFPQSVWDPVEFSGPLRRVVQQMARLEDLMVVYSLSELLSPTPVREDVDREMEFLEELPDGGPGDVVRELRKGDEWGRMGFDDWKVRSMRLVYGWRGRWPAVVEREWRTIGERIEMGGEERGGAWDGLLDFALEGMAFSDDG